LNKGARADCAPVHAGAHAPATAARQLLYDLGNIHRVEHERTGTRTI
jgi:hypothetical protein